MVAATLLLLAAQLCLLGLAQAATYTVWVGYEKAKGPLAGLEVLRMIPRNLRIHKMDTVIFKQMSFDPHTVTFHPGMPPPDLLMNGDEVNPLVLNPTVQAGPYNGTYYLNSGVMSKDSPANTYNVTFSNVGVFNYTCGVHGPVHSGSIIVVEDGVKVKTPAEIRASQLEWERRLLKNAPRVYLRALRSVPKSKKRGDGTLTHYVRMGFAQPPYDFFTFFPRNLVVYPGDTVEFYDSFFHTVTFLNGSPLPPLFVFDPNRQKLVFNPQVLVPANASRPLDRSGFVNSGLIVDRSIKFRLTIGNIRGKIDYACLPHYSSGMKASLTVRTRRRSG